MHQNGMTGKEIGILGGGQLGKMLIQAASNWHVKTHVLEPVQNSPAASICDTFTLGSFRDYEDVLNFGRDKDLLTIEIEDVNTDALDELEKMGKTIYPQPSVIRTIQDKGKQKQFFEDHSIPTSGFRLMASAAEIEEAIASGNLDFPFVQKLRTAGYDGRGVQIINSHSDLPKLFVGASLIEEKVDIHKEISVIVARNPSGETAVYPSVEMVFHPTANLVEYLICPANITMEMERNAEVLAIKTIKSLEMIGVLAVEMFVDKNGGLMVNELAPRPHNSGHHTIESCFTSQYEQHLRSMFNMPLGSTKLHSPAVMVNLLGEEGHEGPAFYDRFEDCIRKEGVYIHIYGKEITKPFRKMGHVTIMDETVESAMEKARFVHKNLKVIT